MIKWSIQVQIQVSKATVKKREYAQKFLSLFCVGWDGMCDTVQYAPRTCKWMNNRIAKQKNIVIGILRTIILCVVNQKGKIG